MASTLVANAKPAGISPRGMAAPVHLDTIDIHNRPDTVLLLGQAHFPSAVEDVYDVLTQTTHEPVSFGIAYIDEDGNGRKVRAAGNCPELSAAAQASALSLGVRHTFVALLQAGLPPSKWLSAVKALPQVHRVFCASAGPVVHVVVATDDQHGRKDIVAVTDGVHAAGFGEDEDDSWLEGDYVTSPGGSTHPRLSGSPPRMSPDQFLQRVGYKRP